MVKCSITNGTATDILARDILNNRTYPDYETCYDKLTLDELKEIMKIVFDKNLSGTPDWRKIGNHREMLTRILRKKLTKNIQNSKKSASNRQFFTSNDQRTLDESVKQIMESISSNRSLHTRSVEEASASESAARLAAEIARPESPRSVFSSNQAKPTPSTMAQYTAEMRSANVARATASSANASAEVQAPVPTNSKLIRITRDKNGIFHKEIVHGSNPKSIDGESRLFRLTREGGTYKIEQVREQSIAPLSKTSGGKRKKTHKRSHRQ